MKFIGKKDFYFLLFIHSKLSFHFQIDTFNLIITSFAYFRCTIHHLKH